MKFNTGKQPERKTFVILGGERGDKYKKTFMKAKNIFCKKLFKTNKLSKKVFWRAFSKTFIWEVNVKNDISEEMF